MKLACTFVRERGGGRELLCFARSLVTVGAREGGVRTHRADVIVQFLAEDNTSANDAVFIAAIGPLLCRAKLLPIIMLARAKLLW
jgi:hypothetical protein